MPLHISTPVLSSTPLGNAVGRKVHLKMEALQPSGSFKMRGIGHACEVYAGRGAKRFVASSGGNAGIAVAVAGARLGIPVIVVVPESTGEHAKGILRAEGAEVVVHGASWMEANKLAMSLMREDDAFLHPFDDPLVWAGHATMIDEVVKHGFKPDAVVLSVGGGGLYLGVVEGLRRNGWDDVAIVAVETEGADSLSQSLAAGRIVTLAAITSIATSLGARTVADQAFEAAMRHPTTFLVVSDRSAVAACSRFLHDHRVLVEPACGAALATVYEAAPALLAYESILVVVCGGSGVTADGLAGWMTRFGIPSGSSSV